MRSINAIAISIAVQSKATIKGNIPIIPREGIGIFTRLDYTPC